MILNNNYENNSKNIIYFSLYKCKIKLTYLLNYNYNFFIKHFKTKTFKLHYLTNQRWSRDFKKKKKVE